MKQLLYHGSTTIVEHPLVGVGRKELDFGPGFYLTPLHEQAVRWASRIRIIRRATDAFVNVYEFHRPADMRIKTFPAYDREWLDFIVGSRRGQQPWQGYDIVEGGIADDRVIDAVEAYINGYADVEHTLAKLIYHEPSFQLCILNQRVADACLHYVSNEKL